MEEEMVNPNSSELPLMTKEIAIDAMRDFFHDKPFVFFGSGMSCALDDRFGMPALKDALLQNICPKFQNSEQGRQWKIVMESLQSGKDLETALDNVTDPALLHKITFATGKIVALIDREYAWQIANREVKWPATRFFERLVDTLPEGDPVLHVLTPNYDTLFEHACDSAEILYTSGFFGGLTRKIDWKAIKQSLLRECQVSRRGQLRKVHKSRKHIRLYKVHGSLNLFSHHNTVIENNSWMWNAPDFANRVIITPGLSKYEMLQNYRQELLKPADEAIDKANRFLFLGYGFNDSHLEAYIKQKLITQSCRGLIVTRDSNSRIESLLNHSEHLWLVCRANQDTVNGTRIFNRQYAESLVLPEKKLWDIETFTTEILGV